MKKDRDSRKIMFCEIIAAVFTALLIVSWFPQTAFSNQLSSGLNTQNDEIIRTAIARQLNKQPQNLTAGD